MTPLELRDARKSLGLSLIQMAGMCGTTRDTYKRWEISEDSPSHRAIPATLPRLVQAYLDGYRPEDWPAVGRLNAKGIKPEEEPTDGSV